MGMKKHLGLGVCCAAGFVALESQATADVLLFEDFEDSSVSYTTSVPEFSDGSGDFFTRTDGSSNVGSFYVINGVQGSSYFAAMDLDGDGNPAEVTLTFAGINISGYTDLGFSGLFAEDDDGTNQDWDAVDFVHIDYQIDGGGYSNLLWFEAEGISTGSNAEPTVDTDFDGIGDGTALTDTLATFSAAIADTGSVLDLRFTIALEAGDEDIAFDNITVTGEVPEPASLALLALGGVTMLGRRRRTA